MEKSFFRPFIFVLGLHLLLVFWGLKFSSPEVQKKSPETGIKVSLVKPSSTHKVTSSSKSFSRPDSKKSIEPVPTSGPQLRPQDQISAAVSSNSLSEQVKSDLRSLYQAELRQKIEENKFYPAMSKRLGHKGLVVIAFTLLEDGNIIDVRVERPSEYEGLNLSALEAVKRVERFRPIPRELGETRMELRIPINFFTI